MVGVLAMICLQPLRSLASSHREAPLISSDPLADNTDLYAFKSPTDAEKIVLIANYVPFGLPSGGPNFDHFGENIRYEVYVDNNAATPGADVVYRFTFKRMNEDPTTFFAIRLGKENLKTTYTCERSTDGGNTFTTIVANGIVPAPNIGPRSIENKTVGLGAMSYEELSQKAIMTASTGERIFCGPVDDPFFVDLGGIFDLGNVRQNTNRDAVAKFNVQTIAIEVPVATLQKSGKSVAQAATILDPDYVIGVYASASRRQIKTINTGGDVGYDGGWVQVSRLGMPLTNEVIIPIGMKDKWNRTKPYGNDAQFNPYLTNPEVALYMDDSQFGSAVPGLAPLRIQTKSLGSFDFRNGKPGLFPLKGKPALDGTALAEAAFGGLLLPDDKSPRAVDLLPIFHTGVPNMRPYQLATGKGGNPLAAGKPFIHNFLPTLSDALRLNMAVPATPRNHPKFNSLGLVYAAVLGLTDPLYNTTTDLQFIPNMDGFPNGRRLEDDITTIELQAVSGVVLAAIGLPYDDYVAGPSPATPTLLRVLGFNAGVTKNDTTLKASFPFEQNPWRGFTGPEYAGTKVQTPASTDLMVTVSDYNCTNGVMTFSRSGGDAAKVVEYQVAGAVNGGYSTSLTRQIEAGVRNDPNNSTVVVMARYVGDPSSLVSYTFNFRARCAGARVGAESSEPLAVHVLGNPTTGGEVTVEVRGASGQSLQLWVNNTQGQRVGQPSVGVADAVEHRTLRLGEQPGIYFLRVVTPTEQKTLKLVRH